MGAQPWPWQAPVAQTGGHEAEAGSRSGPRSFRSQGRSPEGHTGPTLQLSGPGHCGTGRAPWPGAGRGAIGV